METTLSQIFPFEHSKKIIALAIFSACYTSVANADEPKIKTSPFSTEPLHLINKETTKSAPGVKPNVMLFVDDSGSMNTVLKDIKCNRKNYDENGQYNEECRYYVRNGGFYVRPYRRMEATRDAIREVLNQYDPNEPGHVVDDKTGKPIEMNWSLFTLWGSEEPNKDQCPGEAEKETSRIGLVFHDYMSAASIKPVVERLHYESTAVNSRGRRIKCSAYTPATIRYIQAAWKVKNSMKYACQKNYIVMLSDGDANYAGGGRLRTDNAYPFRRSDYSQYDPDSIYGYLPHGYKGNGAGDNNGIAFFSKKLFNADLKTGGVDAEGTSWDDDKYPKQNIETYVVGFGKGLSPNGRRYLESAGVAAPGENGVQPQTYFVVDQPEELVDAFKKIFENVAKSGGGKPQKTTSVSTPANTSSSIEGLAATMTLDTGNWSSELHLNKLDDENKPILNSKGENELESPNYTAQRKFLINNGTETRWLAKDEKTTKDFGFKSVSDRYSEFNHGFYPWITRDKSKSDEQIIATVKALQLTSSDAVVGDYRDRLKDVELKPGENPATADARQMGDVLDSSVVAMGENAKYLMVGANDGMVYLFKKTGASGDSYQLVLNYIPGGMQRESKDDSDTLMRNMYRLAREDYGSSDNPHMYGVNGGIAYVKTPKTGGRQQRIVALGAMGQGGRGVYALSITGCERTTAASITGGSAVCASTGLDVANNKWDKSVPLWESEKGAKNKLGYTVGKPTIYQVAKKWSDKTTPDYASDVLLAGFVANGYQAKNKDVPYDSKPTLYIYNMLGEEMGEDTTGGVLKPNGVKGSVIKTLSASNADGAGALAPAALVDINFDGIVDVAYAGDQFGDMYRFDLRGKPDEWKVSKIYDGNKKQPISAAPAIYRVDEHQVVVTFGTGRDIFESDRTNTDKQAFFGIYDDLDTKEPSQLTTANLEKREIKTANGKRTASVNSPLPKNKKGWFIELEPGVIAGNENKTSEQVVTQPKVLLSTVFFTTRIYENKKTGDVNAVQKAETCIE
ncbi:pilus assembly protein, partial [Suttonella ornithocola]